MVFALDLFDGSFIAGIGVTCALLLIGHWFPWPIPLHPPIGQICRYIYGVASILTGIMVWLFTQKLPELAVGVALIAIAGGIAVALAYGIDAIVRLIRKGLKAERMLRDAKPE